MANEEKKQIDKDRDLYHFESKRREKHRSKSSE